MKPGGPLAPGLVTPELVTPEPVARGGPGAPGPGGRTYTSHRDAVAGGSYVRIVNYHNTVHSGRAALREELARYAQDYRPLRPADLDAFFESGGWPDGRPGFLPVFYEGFRNAYEVAAPVCEELGIVGWFAVVTGFVDCPPAEQELFARSHLIRMAPEEVGAERLAMTWDEVADLANWHVVFPHTASHETVGDCVSEQDICREVVDPKARLDAVTGQDSAAFVWRGGSPYGSRTAHDDALLEAGYRYLVSNTMIQRIQRI